MKRLVDAARDKSIALISKNDRQRTRGNRKRATEEENNKELLTDKKNRIPRRARGTAPNEGVDDARHPQGMFCCEEYGKSPTEDRTQCTDCKSWAHDLCAVAD